MININHKPIEICKSCEKCKIGNAIVADEISIKVTEMNKINIADVVELDKFIQASKTVKNLNCNIIATVEALIKLYANIYFSAKNYL